MTDDHIVRVLNMHHRTVSRHLIRAELSRQRDIQPRDEDPPRRYENEAAGDMFTLT